MLAFEWEQMASVLTPFISSIDNISLESPSYKETWRGSFATDVDIEDIVRRSDTCVLLASPKKREKGNRGTCTEMGTEECPEPVKEVLGCECAPPPPNSYAAILTLKNDIRCEAFGRCLVQKDRTLLNGSSTF